MKVVDVTDRGSELELAAGETFEVRLSDIAGTGYQWVIVGQPDSVELTDEGTAEGADPLPGGERLHSFRFVASGPTRGRIALELRRSWERAEPPEDAFEVFVSTVPDESAVEDRADE